MVTKFMVRKSRCTQHNTEICEEAVNTLHDSVMSLSVMRIPLNLLDDLYTMIKFKPPTVYKN